MADLGWFWLAVVGMDESGYWKLPYRIAEKQKTASLGVCNLAKPDLADARERALMAKATLATGVEPRQAKLAAVAYLLENTSKDVALQWHTKELAGGRWIMLRVYCSVWVQGYLLKAIQQALAELQNLRTASHQWVIKKWRLIKKMKPPLLFYT